MTGPSIKDASFEVSKALPASAGTVYTDGIDLAHANALDDFGARCELLISAPALGATPLPDDETMIYVVQHDDAADFSGAVNLYGTVLTQTGAGGAGAAAATKRVALPGDVKRYVRVAATGSTSIGDCSGSSVTVNLLF